MTILITTVHFLLCFFLIAVILLQAGKGADIGAAFGAGGSQTVFGPRGAATFLSKMTTVVAILFLLTSVALARLAGGTRGGSVLEGAPVEAEAPTIPETPPVLPPEAPLTTPPQK